MERKKSAMESNVISVKKKAIVISGSSGFIGTELRRQLAMRQDLEHSILRVDRNNLSKLNKTEYEEIYLIHLAGKFSLDSTADDDLYNANIFFGKELLENIELNKLKNIIYTNSVYSLREEYTKYFYTKSKNLFTKIINDYKRIYGFNLQELFIDNTYGFNDKRGKIIESIIKSHKSNERFKIAFPNKYIGLIDVIELVKFIINKIECNNSSKILISSKYLFKIGSISEFVNSNKEKSSIKKKINSEKYIEPSLEVIMFDSKLEKFIITELER